MRNGESLLLLINDILDLTKVEAGYLDLDYSRVAIRTLVDEVIALLRVKAQQKNLTLGLIISPEADDLIATDILRAHQVLLNLVGN